MYLSKYLWEVMEAVSKFSNPKDKQKRKERRNSLTSILSTRYFMCFSCFSFYWMSVFIIITEDIKQTKQSTNSKR